MNTTDTHLNNTPRNLIKTVIGKVTVCADERRPDNTVKTLEYTQQSEYAAWWTRMKANPGTYSLCVGVDTYALFLTIRLYAELDATITAVSNAPHFGGVPYGKNDNSPIGTLTKFQHRWNCADVFLSQCFNNSIYSDDNGCKFTVNRRTESERVFLEWERQAKQERGWLIQCVDQERQACKWSMVSHFAGLLDRLDFELKTQFDHFGKVFAP